MCQRKPLSASWLLIMCQRKLCSFHFNSSKEPFSIPPMAAGHVPAEALSGYLPLVKCQRKLSSSHFYVGKGPFSPHRPFFLLRMPIGRRSYASGSSAARIFTIAKGPLVRARHLCSEWLFAAGHVPAEAPQLAFLP